ncbi:hypothetical protein [Aeromonas sp. MrichA-1]|uniref:hypothetical protein n=1 Tax=Aeromonas sp. MrichA-1 TaxID=2823362 RepID=UPI001B328412|nr:hypothetical protein [Aeromonas sp. MrichA-1]MBP4081841.1 hypothetical protein [Aeromonas sp. MrichA-1]
MKKLFAVVSSATGKVVGKAMVDVYGKQMLNDLTLGFLDGEVLSRTEMVFLSSSKGNLDEVEENFSSPEQMCIRGSAYGCDLVLL